MVRSLISIMLIANLFGCTTRYTENALEKKKIALEQLALNLFEDSVLFKPIVNMEQTYDSSVLIGEIELSWADSVWIREGLFLNKTVFLEDYATHLSKPFYDTLEVISSMDYYSDSIKNELTGYLSFGNKHRSDTTRVKLETSGKMRLIKPNYKRNLSDKDVVVSVGKHLESRNTKLVVISIRWRSDDLFFDIGRDYKILFDKNDKMIGAVW